MVYVKREGAFFGNGEDFTLGDIKAHLTFIGPRRKHFQILLQYFMIILTDRTIKQTIVSKESDGRVDIVVCINKKKKKNRNGVGPRTEPSGTPDVTLIGEE